MTVICDFFANLGRGRKFFGPIIEAGGYFKRIKRTFTHFRSHGKIVTIDGEITYTGGMNIGKQYANSGKVKTPWRDTQIRLTGGCVAILENYVNMDTLCSMNKSELEDREDRCQIRKLPQPDHYPNTCQFMVGGVDNHRECMKMCYLSMIRNASKSVRIQSNFFSEPVSDYYANQLAEYGVKIYRYSGYIHAKTMIVDDELCCIGLVNMDIRSLEVDDEICGIFYNNALVHEYQHIYDQDIESSTRFDHEKYLGRGHLCKLREKFFLLFAPLM